MRNVSKEQMVGFTEKAKHGEQEAEPGFLEGLKLMLSHAVFVRDFWNHHLLRSYCYRI